jgi:hypothetical protein
MTKEKRKKQFFLHCALTGCSLPYASFKSKPNCEREPECKKILPRAARGLTSALAYIFKSQSLLFRVGIIHEFNICKSLEKASLFTFYGPVYRLHLLQHADPPVPESR